MRPITHEPERWLPRERLMQRIHASIERHRAFVTRRDGPQGWVAGGPGAERKALHDGAGIRASLLRLGEGSEVPCNTGRREEWVVLDGALRLGAQAIGAGGWLLGEGTALAHARAAAGGARIFVRAVEGDLVPAEAAWWPGPGEGVQTRQPVPADWIGFAPGIELLPFRAVGDVMSMLARFAPGARIPAHHHGLDEHCVMLGGDLFLGDILLRCGEYQLAPEGSDHRELHSDVGCLLFFHGAVDPALAG